MISGRVTQVVVCLLPMQEVPKINPVHPALLFFLLCSLKKSKLSVVSNLQNSGQ